jgi:hypothetical protein
MRKTARVICIAGSLALAVAAGTQARAASTEESSIVITFKDGRQQTFPLATIAHIEFTAPAGRAPVTSRGNFLGRWQVGDGQGNDFIITLSRDGKASKTIGSPHGTWRTVHGEAQITWDDGWQDSIRKVGDKYEKAAHAPGKTFDDPAVNVTDAKSLEPI